MANKKWTEYEDKVILEEIKVNPQNLQKCFIAASKKMDRTKEACSQRWYRRLSKKGENTCFVTLSSKSKSLNRKNGEGQKSSFSIFSKLLKALKW